MDRLDRRTCLALLAGATAALAGCSGDDEPDSTSDPADASVAERSESDLDDGVDDEMDADEAETDADESVSADIALEIGDRLELDDLHLVVTDAEWGTDVLADATADRLEVADDAAFAVVDLAVKHAADEQRESDENAALAVDERVTVALGGDDSGAYDRVSVPDEGVDPTGSRLAPGEVARGDLVYGIDDETGGLVLEIEALADGETTVVDLETTADSVESLEQELAADALSFSEGVELADVTLTVATLEQGNNLGGFMQSDEGHEIVAVGLTLENESGRERSLSAAQAQLTDEFGWRHEVAPGVLRALENVDDTVIADGEDHEGKIAYQIEDGLEELYWVFDGADWGEDRRVCWQLR